MQHQIPALNGQQDLAQQDLEQQDLAQVFLLQELDWLRVLSRISEKIQYALTKTEVAEQLALAGQALGFERVKIWTLCPQGKCLYSVKFVGLPEPEQPVELLVAQSPYATQTMNSHRPLLFKGLSLGPRYLETWFAEREIAPPKGLWVSIPLRTVTDRCLGILTLDNVTKEAKLRREHLQLLGLLGRHAAAAFERALLYERKQRKQKELSVLSEVGKIIIEQAALDDLSDLLHKLWRQISRLMATDHFRVVLLKEETADYEIAFWVKNGREQPSAPLGHEQGLIHHIIEHNKGRFRPYGTAAYQREHQIEAPDQAAKSWMGAVLRSDGRAIGAIILADYEQRGRYIMADWRLLCSLADLVAAAVQASWLRAREQRDKAQLALLQRVSKEMLQVAEENEEWLWLTVLTAVTASYGLRFNRAMVLLLDENEQMLRGYRGIGHLAGRAGKVAWEQEVAEPVAFEAFLVQLRAGRIRPSPLQAILDEFELPWSAELGELYQAAMKGQMVVVAHDAVWQRLPLAFVRQFGATTYAIQPLRHNERVIGVVVVDNLQTQAPLSAVALGYLESLLTQAVLLSRYVRERGIRDQLIDMNLQLMAVTQQQAVGETLLEIGRKTQRMTGADFVAINLLASEERPFVFAAADTVAVNHQGEPLQIQPPRPNGLSEHILRAGTLVVNSVEGHFQPYCGEKLAQHPYFQQEGIASFAGTPIYSHSDDALLGVFYLMYRRPRLFSATETKQMQLFASLTAVAIQNGRQAQAARNNLQLVQDDNQQRIRELDILSSVLQEALAPDLTKVKIVRALLQATSTLLNQPTTRISLFLRQWDVSDSQAPREVRYRYQLYPNQALAPPLPEELDSGLVGQVFRTGKTQSVPDVTVPPWRDLFITSHPQTPTRSELDVAIRSGELTIGVLSIKSPQANAFAVEEQATWQRLAFVAGLALSNVYRQEQVQSVLSATRSVTVPTGLRDTLEVIVNQLRETVPELSCLTIWYSLPGSEVLTLGPHFGLRYPDEVPSVLDRQESTVWQVMLASETIWAEDTTAVSVLYGNFAQREAIRSTAAFPLRYQQEAVGIMFLNYRTPHHFSPQEKYLFSLLAEVVTASLRDAASLEVARKERQRLQTIADIAEIVGSTLDAEEAIKAILSHIVNLFPTMMPYVLLYNARQRVLEMTTASLTFYPLLASDFAHLRRVAIDNDFTLVGQTARLALEQKVTEPLLACDVASYEAYVPVVADTRSQLCLALMNNQELLGVMALESSVVGAFSENDVATLRGIGHQISLALERSRRSRELQFRRTVAATMAWASELAHEINSELGMMQSWAYWIGDEPDNRADVQKWAGNIEAAAVRLVKTMTMTGGEPWPQKEQPYLLDEAIEPWVRELVKKRVSRAQLHFEFACSGVATVMFSGALRRVISHLVHNGLDAAASIGVEPHLFVYTRCLNESWAEVEVADNGPGIAESVRHTLLQEPKSTKGGDRRGYGLLFARSLVEDVKGDLQILPSESGFGARFCFTVPIERNMEVC